jgi:hypothetical protein
MALNRGARFPVSKRLFKLYRVHHVGEQQSQQPNAMPAEKLFDLRAAFDRELL